jgi:MoaA/NifB/PqqE/SkfB family radical SAM enzyme
MDKYFIDGHKLYWHLDRVLQWQKGELPAPVYIEISPVGYCNHRCVFCGIDFAMDKNNHIDTDVLCKSLKELGQSGVRSIMFAGEGEPLLHKDLPLFVSTAKESGIDVSITTNGSIGDYNKWQEILPHLSWLRFSFDAGSAEVYSKVHGVAANTFEKTINNIKSAIKVKQEKNLPVTIGVQYLVIEENLHDIENAVNLFSETGVDYLSFKPYSLHPQMINKKDVVYSEATIKKLEAIKEKYTAATKMNIIFRREAMEKYMSGAKTFSSCRALPFWGYICSDGSFYTCSVFIGDKRFETGNIYTDTMTDILFGKKRLDSACFGKNELVVGDECRLNCRMSRVNEFLEFLSNKPEHVNFI